MYASKRLAEAVRSYSSTELELCGSAVNIASFSHLLKRVDFDAIIDHSSLTHIIKSKAEPASVRIKRLLELISLYSFNLYYIKGKDMMLSDFLSRQNNDDSDPHEILPISSNMHKVLQENYYKIDSYLVQTRSQARSGGIKLPVVHGMRKNLDPSIKLQTQHANSIKGSVIKPCIGQGRAGLKRRRSDPINQLINDQNCHRKFLARPKQKQKNKPSAFQRSNAYYKQCRYRDDTYYAFNPRCSFPSRSDLQAPSHNY